MKKQDIKLVKLNSVIYNNLVKRFNDMANSPEIKDSTEYRGMVVALRKKFPTYNELLAMDLLYTADPIIKVGDEVILCKTWMGKCGVVDDVDNTDMSDAAIVYDIGFVRHGNPKTWEAGIVMKIRGVPKIEILESNEFLPQSDIEHYIKHLELIKSVL